MLKNTLQTCGLICALCLFTTTTMAQRGGGQRGPGGTQGGGGGGGGGGGCMRNSGDSTSASAAFAGLRSRTNSAFAGQNRPGPPPMRDGISNLASRNSDQNRPPTPQQFTLAAMRMDRNGDHKLCREELTTVASAVMAELNRRPQPRPGPPLEADRTTGPVIADKHDVESQKTEAFVNRCLEFDTNKDGSLNVTETRIMAAALIKTLG